MNNILLNGKPIYFFNLNEKNKTKKKPDILEELKYETINNNKYDMLCVDCPW